MSNSLGWIDRNLQNAILTFLAKSPSSESKIEEFSLAHLWNSEKHELQPDFDYLTNKFPDIKNQEFSHWYQIVVCNFYYLHGHNLIERNQVASNYYRITSYGVDFIEQDGGLSAILGIKTVKLHSDTVSELRNLLADKLDKSELPEAEKAKLQEKLAEYGDVGIKHLITKLLDAGVQTLPQLISTLGIPGLFN